MKMYPMFPMLGLLLAPVGCMTAHDHQRNVGIQTEKEWTLGLVQKEIHPGMSQAEVASALGSPNLVSRDAAGRETWIYDKVGQETVYSDSSIAGSVILLSGHSASGAIRQTEKTVTVVIRFDEKGTVATTAYHASSSSRPIALFVSASLALTGCATPGRVVPEPSALQTRSMQTRDWATPNKALVMTAAMNLLQDEGFIIRDGDKDIGFLTARREVDLRKPAKPVSGAQVAAGIGILAAIGAAVYLIAKNNPKDSTSDSAESPTYDRQENKPEPQDRMQITECTVTMTPFGDGTRVRVNFEDEVLNDAGQITRGGPIRDAAVYQEFFQKLDKSLFLEREIVLISTDAVH